MGVNHAAKQEQQKRNKTSSPLDSELDTHANALEHSFFPFWLTM
jgi:hypothetical protein